MLIEVENLSISLGGPTRPVRAVRNVTLRIEKGTIHGLIGESGCGKSITGMAFLGLLPKGARIDATRFDYDGLDLRVAARSLCGKRISLISQDPAAALNPVLSIGRQMDDVIRAHDPGPAATRKDKATDLLEATGLTDSARILASYPHELSGGMQQRVVIAQALASGAEFLIADEPTTALDRTVGKQVLQVLKDLVANRGLTVLMITHDMGVIADCCSRTTVLYAGTSVEDGLSDRVLQQPRHPYTQALLAALPGAVPKGRKLQAIEGHPPKPTQELRGCPFCDRCPAVLPLCHETRPPKRQGSGHQWLCHLEDEHG